MQRNVHLFIRNTTYSR